MNQPATPEELATLERECRETADDDWPERKAEMTRDIKRGLEQWMIIGKITPEKRAELLQLLTPQS